MGPTPSPSYPRLESEVSQNHAELFSLRYCLYREGIIACVEHGSNGSLRITIQQCLNDDCTDVKTHIFEIMKAADPVRSAQQGMIQVEMST